MRRFLGFLVFFVASVGLLAVVLVPLVVTPMIAGLVRNALPFGDQAVDVRVDAGLGLLTGHVDRIDISGRGLATGGVTFGSVDVGITGFSVFDRSFSALDGGVGNAVVPLEDGSSAIAERIDLQGASSSILATARLTPSETERVIRSSLGQAGVVPDSVTLGNGSIRLVASGFPVDARLEAQAGGLVLVASQALPRIVVVAPSSTDPWRIQSVTVTPGGMVLGVTVDGARLLAG